MSATPKRLINRFNVPSTTACHWRSAFIVRKEENNNNNNNKLVKNAVGKIFKTYDPNSIRDIRVNCNLPLIEDTVYMRNAKFVNSFRLKPYCSTRYLYSIHKSHVDYVYLSYLNNYVIQHKLYNLSCVCLVDCTLLILFLFASLFLCKCAVVLTK